MKNTASPVCDIRKLSPALLGDFLHFFDHVAFTDHREWSGCYCIHFHWDAAMEADFQNGKAKHGRDYAAEFIQNGTMQGYLAYLDGAVVGWCNANDKTHFGNLKERKELWDETDGRSRIKSIVCFIVAPGMRGKGISTQLLERVCRDAAAEGFEYVEAYPYVEEADMYVNHHGPFALYRKLGFAVYKQLGRDAIVRKDVRAPGDGAPGR